MKHILWSMCIISSCELTRLGKHVQLVTELLGRSIMRSPNKTSLLLTKIFFYIFEPEFDEELFLSYIERFVVTTVSYVSQSNLEPATSWVWEDMIFVSETSSLFKWNWKIYTHYNLIGHLPTFSHFVFFTLLGLLKKCQK